jgi:hypothetical protein
MKQRTFFASLCVCLLMLSIASKPAQAMAQLTKIVVGCKNFLLAGASYVITPTSQFSVTAKDSLDRVVYSRENSVTPGRYAGFGAPFSGQPAPGPVRIVITLDGMTIADLSGDYPAAASCRMFNPRPDFSFTDGRLNVAEPWQPVAIYCFGDGTLSVLAPYNAGDRNWVEVVRLSQRELTNYPQKPPQNTLVKTNHGVQVYLLTSGELQVVAPTNDPKQNYSFILGGC